MFFFKELIKLFEINSWAFSMDLINLTASDIQLEGYTNNAEWNLESIEII